MKVELINFMGNDLTVVNAARVSFGKHKTEMDKRDKKLIKYLIDHKIAVMGHIGVKPQSINNHKEFKILGKNQDEAKEIFDDAISLESSGVFSLVLELVDEFLTKKITKKLSIPTIGISSGADAGDVVTIVVKGKVSGDNDDIGAVQLEIEVSVQGEYNIQINL